MRGLPPPHPRFDSLVWMILFHQKTIVPGVTLPRPHRSITASVDIALSPVPIVPGVTLPSARLDNHRQCAADHAANLLGTAGRR